LEHEIKRKKLKGWNWGAFLLTWIWGVGNKVWVALLAIIPGVNIIMAVVLGMKGNDWAWQKNRYLSPEEFRNNQKMWAKWGVVAVVLGVTGSIAVIAYATRQMEKLDEIDLRDAKRVVDVRELITSVNHYKQDNDRKCPISLDSLVPKYLKSIPSGPSGEIYQYQADSEECKISVKLENPENSNLIDDSLPGNGDIFDQKSDDLGSYQIWGAE